MRRLFLLFCFFALVIVTSASSPQDQTLPTKIEIPQPADAYDAWDKTATLVQNLAWPLMLLRALYLFRPSIGKVGNAEYAVIDLGSGTEWISPRLFVFDLCADAPEDEIDPGDCLPRRCG